MFDPISQGVYIITYCSFCMQRQHAHEYRDYKKLVQHGLAVPSTKSSVSVVCIVLYATFKLKKKTIKINISVQS